MAAVRELSRQFEVSALFRDREGNAILRGMSPDSDVDVCWRIGRWRQALWAAGFPLFFEMTLVKSQPCGRVPGVGSKTKAI